MGRHNRRRKRNQHQHVANSYTPRHWCYFCEKSYDSEEILTKHQREKHYSCPHCSKKLTATRALLMHGLRVHNHNITSIPNAIEGRDSTRIELFGMRGAPYEWTQQKAAEQQKLFLEHQKKMESLENHSLEPASKKLKPNQSYQSSFVQVEEDRRLHPVTPNQGAQNKGSSSNSSNQPSKKKTTLYYIWPESEILSIEEKRALHPKYHLQA
mmetsp:Transcript_13033/g.19664  ORF Transcript_13033/g.19664 Transcript_13033/m.19664 type:complete len:211 (-) Transcript_13033:120-752(-)